MERLILGAFVGFVGVFAVNRASEIESKTLGTGVLAIGFLVLLVGLALNEWSVNKLLTQPYFGSVLGFCLSFGIPAIFLAKPK